MFCFVCAVCLKCYKTSLGCRHIIINCICIWRYTITGLKRNTTIVYAHTLLWHSFLCQIVLLFFIILFTSRIQHIYNIYTYKFSVILPRKILLYTIPRFQDFAFIYTNYIQMMHIYIHTHCTCKLYLWTFEILWNVYCACARAMFASSSACD